MSLFFYNDSGDTMKVYIDLLLIFNFLIDLLLLMSVSLILKRMATFNRLVLGAFLGSLSVFILFLPISNFLLLFLKIVISVLMIISTFSYRDFSYFMKNMGYFYFASMVLGGMIYLWNTTFSYEGVTSSFISNSYQLKDGDIISVRGYGKFIYKETVKITKKGRAYISLNKYT